MYACGHMYSRDQFYQDTLSMLMFQYAMDDRGLQIYDRFQEFWVVLRQAIFYWVSHVVLNDINLIHQLPRFDSQFLNN
ncbi:hypothetical protein BLOT_013402 [Blomia tropicalis]|nr:hypothetical protein BLOT_013402 [Blomia tropicalis]